MALRPIIVDEDFNVLGGNMRVQALRGMGYKEVPDDWVVQRTDLTPEEKQQFIVKDNVGFGNWDWELLANEWDVSQLSDWGLDVNEYNFDDTDPGDVDWAKEFEEESDHAAELAKRMQITFVITPEYVDILKEWLGLYDANKDKALMTFLDEWQKTDL